MQTKRTYKQKRSKIHKKLRPTGKRSHNSSPGQNRNISMLVNNISIRNMVDSSFSIDNSTRSENISPRKRKHEFSGNYHKNISGTLSELNFNTYSSKNARPFYRFADMKDFRHSNETVDEEFEFFIEDCINKYKHKRFKIPDPLYSFNSEGSDVNYNVVDQVDFSGDEIELSPVSNKAIRDHMLF